MIGAAKSSLNLSVIAITAAIVGCTYLFFVWRDSSAQQAAAQSMMQTPSLAVLLKKDATALPLVQQTLAEGYKQSGDSGLREATVSVQQQLLSASLIDFVWQFDTAALRRYLATQLDLINALQSKAEARSIRLCESFIRSGEMYSFIETFGAAQQMDAYHKASSDLLLSAQKGYMASPLPNAADYEVRLRAALSAYAALYKQAYPKSALPNPANIASANLRSCAHMAPDLFLLLRLPDEQMSLLWRNGMYRSAAVFAAQKAKLKQAAQQIKK